MDKVELLRHQPQVTSLRLAFHDEYRTEDAGNLAAPVESGMNGDRLGVAPALREHEEQDEAAQYKGDGETDGGERECFFDGSRRNR